jgi:hypothetical protein
MDYHEFRLVLDNMSEVSMDDAETLYEAGCSDATFGSCEGVAFGDFDREAKTLEEAIRSAIADVQKAGFTVASVEQVEQTLVSAINSELAGTGNG